MDYFINIKTKKLENNKKMHTLQAKDNMQSNKDFFSKSELEVLEKISEEFKDISTDKISEMSHETRAWKSVDMRQPISIFNLVDKLEDRKFINYLYHEQLSFSNSFDIYKMEK